MGEKIMDLTKTYLPTIAVVSIIMTLVGGSIVVGSYKEKIENLSIRMDRQEIRLVDMVTREEFKELKQVIDDNNKETKASLTEIMKALNLRLK